MKGCFLNWPDVIAAIIVAGAHRVFGRTAQEMAARRSGTAGSASKTAYTRQHPGAILRRCGKGGECGACSHGFEKSGRCGYSIGLGYPPDWGEKP